MPRCILSVAVVWFVLLSTPRISNLTRWQVILRRLLDKSRHRNQATIPPDASGRNSGASTHGLHSNDGRSIDADEELRILGGGARTINLIPAPSPSASDGSKTRTVPMPNSAESASVPSARSISNTETPKRSTERSSGLFAVGLSAQSVFCSPEQSTSATTSLPSAPDSSRYDASIQGPLNFIASNFGIGSGADAMARPPAMPSMDALRQPGAARGENLWFSHLEGAQLPPVPPPSDPLSMLSSFCETSVPPSVQDIFGTSAPGTGTPVATVMVLARL